MEPEELRIAANSATIYAQALGRFNRLLRQAQKTRLNEPTAVALATTSRTGQPSLRTVLLKEVDREGFVFYTNAQSRKGRDLALNRKAALCFFWDPLMKQVLVEGNVQPASHEEADAYWRTRSRERQIGAWASEQSRALDQRATLLKRFARYRRKFAAVEIPRPKYWTGYRLVPHRIEFWTSRPFRLHERVLYEEKNGHWRVCLLYP